MSNVITAEGYDDQQILDAQGHVSSACKFLNRVGCSEKIIEVRTELEKIYIKLSLENLK